jgi:hypothetical protein
MLDSLPVVGEGRGEENSFFARTRGMALTLTLSPEGRGHKK